MALEGLRYDTRCYFNVRSKADISQLNLPHGYRSEHSTNVCATSWGFEHGLLACQIWPPIGEGEGRPKERPNRNMDKNAVFRLFFAHRSDSIHRRSRVKFSAETTPLIPSGTPNSAPGRPLSGFAIDSAPSGPDVRGEAGGPRRASHQTVHIFFISR